MKVAMWRKTKKLAAEGSALLTTYSPLPPAATGNNHPPSAIGHKKEAKSKWLNLELQEPEMGRCVACTSISALAVTR